MRRRVFISLMLEIYCFLVVVPSFAEVDSLNYTGTLTIWSFSDDLQNMSKYFSKAHPEVKVISVIIPNANEAYLNKINQSLRTSFKGAPDVFTGELAYARQFIESGYFEDLTTAPYEADAKVGDMFRYAVDQGRDLGGTYAA